VLPRSWGQGYDKKRGEESGLDGHGLPIRG
jgi:hypothetical protein